ncbi:hypothetical protein MMC26_004127 [Xylographa opegraphella]|nr:hypothetical protein [Xylographa opegraphella]
MADPNQPGNVPLFSQIQFYIVESGELGPNLATKLVKALKDNGAVQHAPSANNANISFDGLTHVISSTIDFEGYEKAEDLLVPVVTPSWVDASVAKRRHANPRSHSPDPRLFFSGLVVCTADLPDGDKDAIVGGVLAMGGLYSSAITKAVTHMVALNMDPAACQIAVAKNLDCKIVLPHWFDDCLRLGRRIDEGPYILPNPEIMRKALTDRIPETARPDLRSAISAQPGPVPTQTGSPSPERRRLNVFKDKSVTLSKDLEIGSHLRRTIEDLIKSAGGSIAGSVNKADIYICHYREGIEYKTASWEGKVVGNLPWLYHLITHNAWTSPLRRLLHYPIARGGLPGFKKFRISLSNYNGEARIYLENLAKAAGCEFTKTMKQDNTHLITAHQVSEKCDAAKEWNINMINHLWLEESYAKWQIQSLTNTRYTHFPPRTNLSEVVGQTPIDRQSLERNFFPKEGKPQEGLEDDGLLDPVEIMDPAIAKNKISNSSAVQPPSSSNEKLPIHKSRNSEGTTPKVVKEPRRLSEGPPLRTPATSRFKAEGKENETPSTTSSRGAKDRAAAKIHNLAPDIALYEKERKRVGGVMYGRTKGENREAELVPKRSISREAEEDVDDESRPAKRPKKAKGAPAMRLLVTGYSVWSNNKKKENEDRIRLRDLGILITPDYLTCTHLAAPKILRTQKFICAISHAPIILSTDFLEACLDANKLLAPEVYPLHDAEGEARHNLTLTAVTARARTNDGHLLRGQAIYCTEHIYGGFDTYKAIVEVNGGKCMLYRARAGSIVAAKVGSLDEEEEEEGSEELEYIYLISGVKPEEQRLWPKFRQMVTAVGKLPRIVRTDWMLDLALSQQARWEDTYEVTAGEAGSSTEA